MNENDYTQFNSRTKEYRKNYYNFHKQRLQDYQRRYYIEKARHKNNFFNGTYKVTRWKGEKFNGMQKLIEVVVPHSNLF